MEFGSAALWLVVNLALLFVGLPLASALFPRLADRGASVALPLVLAVVFLLSYYLGRLSLWAAVLAALLVLGGSCVGLLRRSVDVDVDAYLEMATVFALAFCFLVFLRAMDPAISPVGGEKFLDFGLLKALLRAETLPPEDFWYAGEPMNYYYGGHLLVAQFVRLTSVSPAVAYNLGLATFFGTFVTAAYGLAGNVAARAGRFDRRAALLGGFFVAVASNLFTPLRLALSALPADLAASLARTLGVWAGRFPERSAGALITDEQPFSMWHATGVIDGAIHEMPLFAFLNGDLHAHMMAPTFTLLAGTVLFAYWKTKAAERRRRLGLLFGVVPAVAGIQTVVNTWSFPTVAGLAFLTVWLDRKATDTLLPATLRQRVEGTTLPRGELVRLVLAVTSALAVALLGIVWTIPFWLSNVAGRSVAFVPDRSALADLLVVHGGFLVPIALYGAYLVWYREALGSRELAGLGGLWLVGLALTATLDLAVLGLFGPVLVGGYVLVRRSTEAGTDADSSVGGADRPSIPGFESVLVLGAVGLVILVEFVYVTENAGAGRFNTVFKVYSQVWALFAVGTAVALGRLLAASADRLPTPRWRLGLRAFVVLLVLTLSVYGVLAVGLHVGDYVESDREATLDGTAHLSWTHPDEAAAIDWLDDRRGTPTIVTAPGRAYRWTSAPSAFTGVPTIIGWEHHEHGWGRPLEAVERRANHVDTLYEGSASRQTVLLERYEVRYVYVGPVERDRYGTDITIGDNSVVTATETFGDVTIYEVDRATLEAK